MRKFAKAIVRNRKTMLVPMDERLRYEFSYAVPGYWFSRAYRDGRWDGRKYLAKRGRVPTGLFLALLERLQSRGWKFEISDLRVSPKFHDLTAVLGRFRHARDYQLRMVHSMVSAAKTGGLVLSATGTGKTYLAGMFLAALKEPALFLVDELTLLEQARKEISSVIDEEVGKVGEGVFEPRRVTVATVQTIASSKKEELLQWLESVRVIFVDEVHLALNDRTRTAIAKANPLAVYGLTATLQTERDPVLFEASAMCGPVLAEYGYSSALSDGYLCDGFLATADYLRELGDDIKWSERYYRHIVRSKTRNDVMEQLARLAHAAGRRVCLLVGRIQHIEILSARLSDIPHRLAYGAVSGQQRDSARTAMENGEVRLIIANRVFEKGINIRSLDFIIDGTMGKSSDGVRQRFGRGVRLLEGKGELVYVDIGDVASGGKNVFHRTTEERRKSLLAQGVTVAASVRFKQGEGREAAEALWRQISKYIDGDGRHARR